MDEPFVSILIPVRNEERYVERCLYSVAGQDYPRERIEVIVIDGRSDDSTREIVTRFAHESTLDLRLLDNPRLIPAAAMNVGLRTARGEILLRLDGHAALAPDYVWRCVRALFDDDAECAGGALANEGDTYMGRAIAAAMSSRFGVGGATFRTGGRGGEVDTVAFGAYRREVFAQIGGFAEELPGGEDDDFNYRLRDAGGRIVLVPDARAAYTVRGSLGGLWKQYFSYGRAKPAVLSRHVRQMQPRQLAPVALVVGAAAGAAVAATGRPGLLKLVVVVYALAATTASLALGHRHGWRLTPPLPAVFACLHVAYGLGFLAGLLGLAGSSGGRGARAGAHEGTESPRA